MDQNLFDTQMPTTPIWQKKRKPLTFPSILNSYSLNTGLLPTNIASLTKASLVYCDLNVKTFKPITSVKFPHKSLLMHIFHLHMKPDQCKFPWLL